ncbi:MAG: hypothetical protein HY305_06315, partial [Sphingobacteriales bacterium]|nr:hypothetical protein [Sphingobacteriales bacterium]
MGKKKKAIELPVQPVKKTPEVQQKEMGQRWYSLKGFQMQALALIIIGLVCFANSFYNEYALDDDIIILKNEYVQQGFKGIPKIMSSDALESFYKQFFAEQELSGGRYRPLSIVTFAIEQQLFGSKAAIKPANDVAFVRHVGNVIFYILSIVVLLYFLRNFIFKHQVFIAFFTSLLFLIHPIHTEVVANVKSRDEILSFLFIIATFIAAFRYYETKKYQYLAGGLVFYFFALLSKEYAITVLVLMPMLFYIVKKETIAKSIASALPFFFIALLYILIRLSIVGVGSTGENQEVLNNPFLYATDIEKLATKIGILDNYLKLLFYPNPLSSDYSFSTIPYSNFESGWVWLSLIIHLSLIVAAIILFIRRNIMSFAITFYLLHLLLVSNLFFDLGATMGERLIYHSSFGFFILIAIAIDWLLKKIQQPGLQKALGTIVCCLLVFWCAAKDIKRNAEWKNSTTLFLTDVKTVPNSVLANGNAGKALIDQSMLPANKDKRVKLLDSAIQYVSKAVITHDKYVNGYLNLGFAYCQLKEFDKAKVYWDKAKELYPQNPYLPGYYGELGAGYSNKG